MLWTLRLPLDKVDAAFQAGKKSATVIAMLVAIALFKQMDQELELVAAGKGSGMMSYVNAAAQER